MKEIIRYGFTLALICVVASASLAVVYSLTRPTIVARAKAEEEASLKEVLPQAANFAPVESGDAILYYKAYNPDGKLIGVAFKASAKGYSGIIETMAGMSKDGIITAIKVLSQNETPGLGARIVEVSDDTTIWDLFRGKKKIENEKKPWFQEQFSAKRIEGLKDIQAITGATISSKAVIDSVQKKAEEIKILIKDER